MFEIDQSYFFKLKKEREGLATNEERDTIKKAWEQNDKEQLTRILQTTTERLEKNVPLKRDASIRAAIEKLDLPNIQETIKAILVENNADAGLVVLDKLSWTAEDRTYCFKSSTIIFDREGRDVWSFISRGYTLSPFEFGSLLWVSPNEIGRYYSPFINYFPKFLVNLLEEDMAGRQHQGSPEAYDKGNNIAIIGDHPSVATCPGL
jgi:hypothetical protein